MTERSVMLSANQSSNADCARGFVAVVARSARVAPVAIQFAAQEG